MKNPATFAVLFSSLYLLIYIVLLNTVVQLAWLLFLFSPLVILLTVFTVIRYGKYNGRELNEGEEWGYGDWKG